VFFEAFIVEEGDGVGEKGSGDATPLYAQTLLEAFLNMSQSACFIDEACLW
jgi:hypothetical protein